MGAARPLVFLGHRRQLLAHSREVTLRVLSVNVRSGGTRAKIDALLQRCFSHDCDALVLPEFRDNASGERIREILLDNGYVHQAAYPHKGNGVLLAARRAFRPTPNPFGLDENEYPQAVLQGDFEDGLRLFGVYLPGQDRKRPHLRCLIAAAEHCNEAGIDAMCIGDLNSGRNETDIEANVGRTRLRDSFSTADLYAELERHWTEAWLYRHPGKIEFSWYPFRLEEQTPRRNGWRIDKAFVSRSLLPRLISAEYDHGFRTELLTDHSGLIVTLSPRRGNDSVPA
jgi:exonuclease III